MDARTRLGGKPARRLRFGMVSLLLPCVFVFDTVTNYEIAGAVFYIVVILLTVGLLSTRGVIALAAVCIGLTLLSLALTPGGNREAGLVNAGISISAISITTFLAIRTLIAEAAANEARAQLTRIARITSLGALTTSIAHEINQPLTAIVTSGQAGLRWMDQTPSDPDKVRRNLERIVADANRASAVIARIRRLAGGAAPTKARIRLADVIADTLSLAEADLIRHDIEVETHFSDDLPEIVTDPVQLQQVLSNLILNAIEALKPLAGQDRKLVIEASATRDDEIVVCVRDNGPGLRPEVLDHLFDPFFTTKDQGIGMGLTISRSIVDAHGGQIWAKANESGGASFYFSLPVKDPSAT